MFADNVLGLKFWILEGHAQGPLALLVLFIIAMTVVLRFKR